MCVCARKRVKASRRTDTEKCAGYRGERIPRVGECVQSARACVCVCVQGSVSMLPDVQTQRNVLVSGGERIPEYEDVKYSVCVCAFVCSGVCQSGQTAYEHREMCWRLGGTGSSGRCV